MFLFPKKARFNKSFSGSRLTVKNLKNSVISLNKRANVSLIAKENGKITNFQIEAIRRFLRRFLKKRAQLFFQVFPNMPITKKPNDIRQGRGKGTLKYWTSFLKKDDIIVEIQGKDVRFICSVLKAVCVKLSIKTYIFNQYRRWIL